MTAFKVGDRVYTSYDTKDGSPIFGEISAESNGHFTVLFEDGEWGDYAGSELEAAPTEKEKSA
jgi:hypothetical protein